MATMDGDPQQSPEIEQGKLVLTAPPENGGGTGAANAAVAGGVAPAVKTAAWKGRRVKRFRLIDELGEGAMGRVYVAEDEVLKRNVALKLLPARHRDGRTNTRTERLVGEARSAATLEHPNVVTIYEIDQIQGVHYIAMELAEGGNLERLVQLSGPMEIERACQLVADAAEALSHAHARGIIHRDIKPANLLLTRSGRCKLADFGLAAIDHPDDPARMKCVGTPNFIAPEVARGKGASAASDIYSLGCTLWFLLTGRPPFTGESTREVLKLHVNQPLPDIRKWRGDVPERLVATIAQACAKKPAERWDDAEKFAKVLRTFTIPAGGSNGGVVPVASAPHMSGYVMLSGSHGHMQPVNALSSVPVGGGSRAMGSMAGPAVSGEIPTNGEARRWNLPPGIVWAGAGMAVTALMITLGIFLARQGPKEAAANAPAAAPAGAPAPGALFDVKTDGSAPAAKPPFGSEPQGRGQAAAVASGENMLSNGGIDEAMSGGRLSGWYIAERCVPMTQTLDEAGNKFMRLTNTDPTTTAHADQKIDIDPSWRSVTLSARMRASNFKAGKKGASGVSFAFQDDEGKQVGRFPPPLLITEDTPWVNRVATVTVPAGAKKLYLQCVVSYTTGTIDFDDVKVVAQR